MQSIFDVDENTEQETEETIEVSPTTTDVSEPSVIPETIEPLEVSEEIKESKKDKKSWKQWFETEDAVRTIYLVFGFFAIVLLMVLLQFSTQAICCGDWGGYYHIRWSALLWENFSQFKWLPEFKWLPLTVLNPKDYADHHFLFHVLQIPFLWFFEPVMAAKLAAVTFGSLAIFSVYWLMFRYKVDYLLLWLAALLTCSNPFFYRMNMAKAPPLTIIYTVVGIYLLFERKYIWLLPLMFIFVWTYSLFPLLFLAAVIWTAIIGWNERKFEWKPLAYTGGGMILGNIINPYFPNNLLLFFEHFWTKFRSDYAVSVGGEWYPYDGWQILTHLTIALIAMLIGYILFKPRNGKLPEKSTFFLVFTTLLLIWMFKSKRLAEYFPPFAILFGAFSWKAFFVSDVPQLPEEFIRDIEPLLDSDKKTEKQEAVEIFKKSVPWAIGLILLGIMFFNFGGTKLIGLKQEDLLSSIQKNEANDKYEESMDWAKKNIPAGERIFNCNWDDFPKLFFFNTKNTYVYGLDPNYLFSENPDLSKLIKEITSGKIDDPAPLIREKFGSRWIFSDAKENVDFIAKILESGWADTVYEDGEAYILKIRDKKGEPPQETVAPPTPAEEKILETEEKNDANAVNKNENVNQDEINDEEEPDEEEDLPPEN
ncbi:MAG: hypothetical protein ACR2J3_04980 [Aridibacter sp.]